MDCTECDVSDELRIRGLDSPVDVECVESSRVRKVCESVG